MLDAIKVEFDNVSQEATTYKSYKDDYEHKSEPLRPLARFPKWLTVIVTSQIQEMQSVRQNVYELQMAHDKMKLMYARRHHFRFSVGTLADSR